MSEIPASAAMTRYVLVVKADVDLPDGIARALWVGTAGTANLQQDNGVIRANVPLKEGLFPCKIKQVRIGGTATDIWAIY